MEILVNFSLISEYFTSILFSIDQFLISSFQINTSFASNTDQTIVYILVLFIGCGLFILFRTENNKRTKRSEFLEKSIETTKLKPKIEKIQSSDSQNMGAANKNNKIDEKRTEVGTFEQDNEKVSFDKSHILELDNGFVINKRNIDVKEVKKTTENPDTLPNDREEKNETNNISEFLSINKSDAEANLTKELSEIEAAMLDVRQEYKAGKISSTDYLSKTQSLYKQGEHLLEK